jgi:hypothetical protein
MTRKESMKEAAVLLLRGCTKLVKYIKKEKLDDPEFLEFIKTFEDYKESIKQ